MGGGTGDKGHDNARPPANWCRHLHPTTSTFSRGTCSGQRHTTFGAVSRVPGVILGLNRAEKTKKKYMLSLFEHSSSPSSQMLCQHRSIVVSGRTRYKPCTWVWPVSSILSSPPLFSPSSPFFRLPMGPFSPLSPPPLSATSLLPRLPRLFLTLHHLLLHKSIASFLRFPPSLSKLSPPFLPISTLPTAFEHPRLPNSDRFDCATNPCYNCQAPPSKALQTIRVELGDCGLCPRPTTHSPRGPSARTLGFFPRSCCVCLRKVSVLFVAPPILRLILRRSAIASSS